MKNPSATEKAMELAEKLGPFLHRVMGGALEEAGGIAKDWVSYYRYANLLTIKDKVQALHRERGLEEHSQTIPVRHAVRILETASMEDDNSLQNMWARLIANATDPGTSLSLHPAYADVIAQLCHDEALILEAASQFDGFPVLFTVRADRTGFFGVLSPDPGEPPRLFRRLFRLSQAARADPLVWA